MGKRSNFERIERDYYPTPYRAVVPLIPYLVSGNFIEPCAGDGRLVKHLEKHGMICYLAADIEPQADFIVKMDVFEHEKKHIQYITNPPWTRKLLHKIIEHLRNNGPTWLLFDADWMHTTQATPFLKYCSKIVSVGRISWMDNGVDGKDNVCWYLFHEEKLGPPVFHMDRIDERNKRCHKTKDMFGD